MAKITNGLTFLSDGAPTTLVSLIGHKQYRRCARDIYYFTQVEFLSLSLSTMTTFLFLFFTFRSFDFLHVFICNYHPLQSTICVKQLAYAILELVLMSVFPELRDLVMDIHGKKPIKVA